MVDFAIISKSDNKIICNNFSLNLGDNLDEYRVKDIQIDGKSFFQEFRENTHFMLIVRSVKTDTSNRYKFVKEFSFLVDIIEKLSVFLIARNEEMTSQFSRFIHNIKTATANNIHDFDEYVSKDESTELRDRIGELVTKYPSETSNLLTRVRKNAQSMKDEIYIYDLFSDLIGAKEKIKIRLCKVHPKIKGIIESYFSEFQEKGLTVKLHPSSMTINIDHSCFGAILRHIIDNALKYCLRNTQIEISFPQYSDGTFQLVFDMISLEVDEDEIELIFNKGYSGKNAKIKGLNGSGSGMWIIKGLCELNEVEVAFAPGAHYRSERIEDNSIRYSRNKITLTSKRSGFLK